MISAVVIPLFVSSYSLSCCSFAYLGFIKFIITILIFEVIFRCVYNIIRFFPYCCISCILCGNCLCNSRLPSDKFITICSFNIINNIIRCICCFPLGIYNSVFIRHYIRNIIFLSECFICVPACKCIALFNRICRLGNLSAIFSYNCIYHRTSVSLECNIITIS